MEDRIKIPDIKNQVYTLFLSCGLSFKPDNSPICKENKKIARIYTDALKDIDHGGIRLYTDEIIKEGIARSIKKCDHLSNPLPKLPMILDICGKLVKYNSQPKENLEEDNNLEPMSEGTMREEIQRQAKGGNQFAIAYLERVK